MTVSNYLRELCLINLWHLLHLIKHLTIGHVFDQRLVFVSGHTGSGAFHLTISSARKLIKASVHNEGQNTPAYRDGVLREK